MQNEALGQPHCGRSAPPPLPGVPPIVPLRTGHPGGRADHLPNASSCMNLHAIALEGGAGRLSLEPPLRLLDQVQEAGYFVGWWGVGEALKRFGGQALLEKQGDVESLPPAVEYFETGTLRLPIGATIAEGHDAAQSRAASLQVVKRSVVVGGEFLSHNLSPGAKRRRLKTF